MPFVVTHWINLVSMAFLIITGILIHFPLIPGSMGIVRGLHEHSASGDSHGRLALDTFRTGRTVTAGATAGTATGAATGAGRRIGRAVCACDNEHVTTADADVTKCLNALVDSRHGE